MKKAIPIVFAFLFLFVSVYLCLVVWRWGPMVTFLIAFTGAMAIKFGGDKLINMFENSDIFSSKWFIITIASIVVIVTIALIYNFYMDLRVGYKEGDYSNYECVMCGDPADGGVFISGRDINDYYCTFHYEWIKDRAEQLGDTLSKSDVWNEAKGIVEDRLKAPSTAKFCSMSQANIKQNGDTWTISGYVDAENSFGASIRNNFTVVITFTNDTHYTIDKCEITIK